MGSRVSRWRLAVELADGERVSDIVATEPEALVCALTLVRDAGGQPLHAAANVGAGQRLNIEFADGRIAATTDGDAPPADAPKAAAKPASKRTTDFGVRKAQGDLF